MLGDILGRRAGEMVAEEVLCLFLLARPPRPSTFPGFANTSADSDRINMVLGVLEAVSFADFADNVGVVSLSSPALLVSIVASTGGATETAAGNIISSMSSSPSLGRPACSIAFDDSAWSLGILIRVAGVTALPLEFFCPSTAGRGDLEGWGIGGGRIAASDNGSGETESSLAWKEVLPGPDGSRLEPADACASMGPSLSREIELSDG